MSNLRLTLVAFATLCVMLTGCGPNTTPPTQTQYGPVIGIDEEGVAVYRGIPYAAPPIGDLRWKAPQPPAAWQEPLAAHEFGAFCWQDTAGGNADFMTLLTAGAGMGGFTQWLLSTATSLATPEVSEDCLTLNVATPDHEASLPVMFWIHGGGHQFGSGGGPYESPSLVKEGVVLVSLNYRLGLYGFLAHPELAEEHPHGSTGNYGTLDQIAALQWVRDNIANFGGDPDNVTIFGESAGGHSVGQLMATPLAADLFHRAIAQSGTGFYQFQAVDAAHERLSGFDAGREVAKLMDVAGSDEIAALRTFSTEALKEAATDAVLSATYHPQIDGYVLPASTAEIFAEGLQAQVPLVVGSNADEGSVLYYFGLAPVDGGPVRSPQTVTQWNALLSEQFGEQAQQVDIAYRVDTDADVEKAAEQLMGDTWFGRHAFYMAQKHSAAGHPTYLYFYERQPPSEHQTIGASHALELNHVFGGFIPLWPTDARDNALQAEMQAYWTTFAETGDPNEAHLPSWERFADLEPREMAFGHEATHSRRVAREDRYRAMQAQFESRVTNASGAGGR